MLFGKIGNRTLLTSMMMLLGGILTICPAQELSTVDDLFADSDTIEVDTVLIDKNIAVFFREMPDSLLPTLSKNNRLDMVDFMTYGMESEVTNRLGGGSEMTMLTDDSLRIKVSDALTFTLILVSPLDSIQNGDKIICLIRTYGTNESVLQSAVSFYTTQWKRIDEIPSLNDNDKERIRVLDVQTILNWKHDILKKD